MKSLIIVLSVLLVSQSSLSAVCNSAHNSYGQRKAEAMSQFRAKLSLSKEIVDFLELDISKADDWDFLYLRGKTRSGANRNLQLELSQIPLLRASETDLSKLVDEHLHAEETKGLTSTLSLGRVGLSIDGATYHHSWVLGNQNKNYQNYFLFFSPTTKIGRTTVSEQKLFTEIESSYVRDGQTIRVIQTITIDKSSSPITVTITERTVNGLLRTDLWSRSTTIYIDRLNWETRPQVDGQTFGP